MQPIISPWIIYLIGLTEPIIIILALIATGSVICLIASLTDAEYKYVKVNSIIFAISLLAVILVPTEQTCYRMLVASYVTTDNIKAIANQENLNAVRDGVKLDLRDIVKAVVEPVTDSIIKVQKEENK